MITSKPAVSATLSVEQVMQLLTTNPEFLIAAMVNNNYSAVASRYTTFTGQAAPGSKEKLIAALQRMRSGGNGQKALRIIAVRWVPKGDGPMDKAVAAVSSEGNARLNDRTTGAAPKSLPYNNDNPTDVAGSGGGVTGDAEEDNDFWNSLPGLILATGSLVNAFTGNGAPATGTSGAGAPPEASSTNWLNVILITLGVCALVAGIYFIVRVVRGNS